MKKYDQISSLVWLLFAIIISIESIRLPLGSFRNPDAGFLPLGMGIILGILSGMNFLKSCLNKTQGARESWYSKEKWPKLILILVALFSYSICLEIVGFLVSTFFLLLFLLRAIEPQRWIVTMGFSTLSSFAIYIIFEVLLRVQLPRGIWGF